MKDQHLKQINELKDIYVAFDKFFLRKETEARNEYGSTRDDMKNKVRQYSRNYKFSVEWLSNLNRREFLVLWM